MESEDYHFYQGLVYLLENDVSTLGYDLTFSTEVSWGITLELTLCINSSEKALWLHQTGNRIGKIVQAVS